MGWMTHKGWLATFLFLCAAAPVIAYQRIKRFFVKE